MNKLELIRLATDFVETDADNYINTENAISDTSVGMRIFENPIFAFGYVEDKIFTLLQDQNVIGGHFKTPTEWLPQAKTVISFFLPFTENVKISNRQDKIWPSQEWLHGRIEGQAFLNKLTDYLQKELINSGYKSIAPSIDKNFWSKQKPDDKDKFSFTSNWSERHVAFVCGLGTFGLSKGLITSKGMAGRFSSIVTELDIIPTEREYDDVYEYCSECGACITRCPVNAITFENGKNHMICCDFVDLTKTKYKRYGCGKCQVSVPCESCIPTI